MSKDLIIRSSSAEFLIFERQTHDKGIQVRFEDGDLWLTQKSIGELFDTTRNNITMHINEIYKNFELDEKSTSKDFLLVQKEGNSNNNFNAMLLPKDSNLVNNIIKDSYIFDFITLKKNIRKKKRKQL